MSNSYMIEVPLDHEIARIDAFIAKNLEGYSRVIIQQAIKAKKCYQNGELVKPSSEIIPGATISIELLQDYSQKVELKPYDFSLDIVYEDEYFLVVNKPAGITVHPGAGERDGTLANALVFYSFKLSELPRAGLVHRLDKDTSGLILVAKNKVIMTKLQDMLQSRDIKRQYFAIVHGEVISGQTIDKSLDRDPKHRLKKAVHPNGKRAITHFVVANRFKNFTGLNVELETGRTHQIRVHLSWLGFPIMGDNLYNRFSNPWISRQALHAYNLSFLHPITGESLVFEAPMPKDIEYVLDNMTDFG